MKVSRTFKGCFKYLFYCFYLTHLIFNLKSMISNLKLFFKRSFAIWEVFREEEFSPLKNSDDAKNETPTTCRHDLYGQHYRWLIKSGAKFETDDKNVECEISPLVAYNGEVS